MENNPKNQWLLPTIIVVVLVVVIGGLVWRQGSKSNRESTGSKIKIGIIADITGPAAYFGEATVVGAEMAKADLAKEGYNVDLIYEDYQLDPVKALTSAKKLVEVDKVDGIYTEFNPAIYSITPYLKSLQNDNTLFVYEAGPTSPLKDLPYAFKTNFNYEIGCRDLAKKYQDQGVKKMGVLKANMEFGEICNTAIKGVYGDNTLTEAYNPGLKDFNTQVLKFKQAGVGAIINVSFEGDTLTAFKAMKENNFIVPYGTVTDSIGNDTKVAYPDMIKNVTTFGFTDLDPAFVARVKQSAGSKNLTSDYPAATAFLHIKQMVGAINGSNGDIKTIFAKMANSPAEKLLDFGGFDKDRIAIFKMDIGSVK